MRKGTTAAFWKKYEALQISMISSCMPKTALASGMQPMTIQAPLAFCTVPTRQRPSADFGTTTLLQ